MITCKFEDGGDGQLRHVVVHILAVKENKILLVKRAPGILEAGKWGFPGGFLDQGENVKICVLRELMEETGYNGEVKELFRINSSPNRRNDQGRNNVAFEFLVETGDKTGTPDWEQTAVEWKDIDGLSEDIMAFDHFLTIEALKKYMSEKFPLPLIV
ncbi:MAG: NUDIX domain-containing protein [Candidatus Levybacteria bacterium]|nr:NUDIX domain-containing protein [Candidatus Levybacteria bacterium]